MYLLGLSIIDQAIYQYMHYINSSWPKYKRWLVEFEVSLHSNKRDICRAISQVVRSVDESYYHLRKLMKQKQPKLKSLIKKALGQYLSIGKIQGYTYISIHLLGFNKGKKYICCSLFSRPKPNKTYVC